MRQGCSAAPGTRGSTQNTSSEDVGGRGRCSGNRCCELPGTGWRNPVPDRCGRRQCGEQAPRRASGRHHALRRGPAVRRRVRRELRAGPPGAPASRAGRPARQRAGRHGQDRGPEPRRLLPGGGGQSRPALGHSHRPRPQPQRPGGAGHRRPGAQRGRGARRAVGLAGGGRRRRLPGARRQLLRAPEPAQAR